VRDAPAPEAKTPAAWFWGLVAGGVALDQLTKLLAWLALDKHTFVTGIPYLLYFRIALNPGMAFSLGARLGAAAPAVLVLLNCVIIGVVIWIRTKADVPAMRRLFDVAMGLILAGAFGNVIDRVHPPFKVIDFIDLWLGRAGTSTLHWPTFNVADIYIVVGVGIYILWAFRSERAAKAEEKRP
jgi:signal peptidase II